MFTGCGDGIARAYDAKSATLKRIFQGHEGAINCLACVDDKLYTGSSDSTMRVWDAKDISEDLNVNEEPPPAPPVAVVEDDPGLEKELEKLEAEEAELQETPEDGIIDDDQPNPPEDTAATEEEIGKVGDDDAPPASEEVLTSG